MRKKHSTFERDIAIAKAEEERLATVALLLGAEWSELMKCFVKTDKGVAANGIPWHWKTYYDRHGVEVSRMDMAAKELAAEKIAYRPRDPGKSHATDAMRYMSQSIGLGIKKANVYKTDFVV